MSFVSCAELLAAAAATKKPLHLVILESDLAESDLTHAQSTAQMQRLWQVMQETSADYNPVQKSNSGLSGGDAAKVDAARLAGTLLGGDYLNCVIAEALKTAECNACMKRVVAAPTAGSCGVLPAVFLPLLWQGEAGTAGKVDPAGEVDAAGKVDAANVASEANEVNKASITSEASEVSKASEANTAICDALYVAAGFGQIIAHRATLAGAEGGCQAEVGAASAMAAAALTYLKGGSNAQCADAAAMALGNLLGLVCDPVAGLVEVPCVKRNVIGAVNAVSCANMALAGVSFQIPFDEVVDAMGRVGTLLSIDLRETGVGGLAGTPTGRKIAEELA